MNVKDIIEKLNNQKIVQVAIDIYDQENEDIDELLKGSEKVASNLNIDRHRWYETSTTVYKLEDGTFIGVEAISNVFSENSTVEDCFHCLEFMEMEEVPATTYKKK